MRVKVKNCENIFYGYANWVEESCCRPGEGIEWGDVVLYHAFVLLENPGDLDKTPVPGCPRYHCEDIVRIKWDETEKIGKVCIVDAFGTFGQSEEPSYDIFVEEDNCLYKHICESDVLGKVIK